jgi:hypothetical protein
MLEAPLWIGWAADSWGVSWGYDESGTPIEVESDLVPAGHWKHLFRPIRAVEAHGVSVRGATRWRIAPPQAFDLRQSADAPAVFARGGVRFSVLAPHSGTRAPTARARVRGHTAVRRPRGGSTAPFIRFQAYTRVESATPTAGCAAPGVSRRGRVYYSLYTPKTVQNPTVEMIMALLAA